MMIISLILYFAACYLSAYLLFKIFLLLGLFRQTRLENLYTVVDVKTNNTISIISDREFTKVYSEKELLRKIPKGVNVMLNYV